MALFKRSRFTEIPQDVDLTAIDRESKYRNFKGTQQKLLTAALTCFSLFQLYASLSGMIPSRFCGMSTWDSPSALRTSCTRRPKIPTATR